MTKTRRFLRFVRSPRSSVTGEFCSFSPVDSPALLLVESDGFSPCVGQRLVIHMGVAKGGLDGLVAHQLLQDPDVHTRLDSPRSVGMSTTVEYERGVFEQAHRLPRLLPCPTQFPIPRHPCGDESHQDSVDFLGQRHRPGRPVLRV